MYLRTLDTYRSETHSKEMQSVRRTIRTKPSMIGEIISENTNLRTIAEILWSMAIRERCTDKIGFELVYSRMVSFPK